MLRIGFFFSYLQNFKEQTENPYPFELFHKKIRTPFDYYQFGIDFLRPLIDEEKSHIGHPEIVQQMIEQLGRGENVILLANHQSEIDPQVISYALEPYNFGADVIFLAGHRVTVDPMAIPFSMGRDLLCIYSKRHIDNPPEQKLEKQQHNQKTMQKMRALLSDGGKCIYMAPSGGRDRKGADGEVEVAEFDPQSIEMFRLMAKKSGSVCHFYPLALSTYDILPPPDTVQQELGEQRIVKRHGSLISFGPEIDMNAFEDQGLDRHQLRAKRAQHIYDLVNTEYQALKNR